MTEYPEVVLAKEKEMCFCAIAVVTAEKVIKGFKDNIEKAKRIILEMVKDWPGKTDCCCQKSLLRARFD